MGAALLFYLVEVQHLVLRAAGTRTEAETMVLFKTQISLDQRAFSR